VRKYKVTYDVKVVPEGVGRDELRAQGRGGCDNLVLISIVGTPCAPEPISFALGSWSGDKRNDELKGLDANQLFQVWEVMAAVLAENPDLSPGRREVVKLVLDLGRTARGLARPEEPDVEGD